MLLVGHCDFDHGRLQQMLMRHFDVRVERAMVIDDALKKMRKAPYALVLLNRVIFADGSDGMVLLRAAKSDPDLAKQKVMLISNYSDAQATAAEAGAVPGFGKAVIEDRQTQELLSAHLPRPI